MENWIYRVLRAGGADDVYLVHIDPAVFVGAEHAQRTISEKKYCGVWCWSVSGQ